jgi:predicted GNAT family N-acyltransferase
VRIEQVDGERTRELRRAVLRPNWPTGSPMHGDDNPDATHFAALDGGSVIACCLVFPRTYPLRPEEPAAWQLRGMATAPDRQGQGLGGMVLAAAVDHVARRGAVLMWCEARTTALVFYAQHGFTVDGPEFLHAESGIPHHRMWRAVAAG